MRTPGPDDKDIVLIVDDTPDNLAVITDALDDAGYMVLVATDGASALERLRHIRPDLILMDAIMPGMDGFETCRRMKLSEALRWIPVVFMTGLTETEDIVRGFQAGGVDYVTKPIRPDEVLARIATHISNARRVQQTQDAMERAGQAILLVDEDGTITWQTRKAFEWLADSEEGGISTPLIKGILLPWFHDQVREALAGATVDAKPLTVLSGSRPFEVRFLGGVGRGEFLLLLDDAAPAQTAASLMRAYSLTQRETEVLLWVAKGKTNRDIGEILEMSPRTVNKHLEHVFVKLGVETRTAAAALVNGKGG